MKRNVLFTAVFLCSISAYHESAAEGHNQAPSECSRLTTQRFDGFKLSRLFSRKRNVVDASCVKSLLLRSQLDEEYFQSNKVDLAFRVGWNQVAAERPGHKSYSVLATLVSDEDKPETSSKSKITTLPGYTTRH